MLRVGMQHPPPPPLAHWVAAELEFCGDQTYNQLLGESKGLILILLEHFGHCLPFALSNSQPPWMSPMAKTLVHLVAMVGPPH